MEGMIDLANRNDRPFSYQIATVLSPSRPMPRPADLTFRQLEYLVALADTLGFHRAAERVHVSQPALSAQVQQAEAVLGVQLFERNQRRVLLTAAGARWWPGPGGCCARPRTCWPAPASAGPVPGQLAPGAHPHRGALPAAGDPAGRGPAHPHLRLLLREERTPVLVRELADGGLEAAILAEVPDLGDLEREALAQDPSSWRRPGTTPWRASAGWPWRTWRAPPMLLLEDGHCLRGQALAFCAQAGAREADFRASSLATLVQMVAGGLGLTLLPSLCAPLERSRAHLALRPFPDPAPARQLVLAWRHGSPVEPALRTFAQDLRDHWPARA